MSGSPATAEFPAWGGRAVVAVDSPQHLDEALLTVQRVVADVDLACSSFRDDSELARLNRAGGAPTAVSTLLIEHVQAALRAAEVSGGYVDPTVGQALVALGFTPDGAATGERLTIRAVPGYRTVRVDASEHTIRLGRGVRLDLGATAKALAADQAAAAVRAVTGAGVLVSLGGDLSISGPAPQGGWRIRVTDDHRSGADAPGQWISVTSGGLATSSTTVRGHGDGRDRVHHVIDPRTGAPADVHFRTASVAAATCLDANIASTAAIVRGQAAAEWLRALGLPSRLVGLDGAVQHVAGWPDEGEEQHLAVAPVGGAA